MNPSRYSAAASSTGPAVKLSETMTKRGVNKTTSDQMILLDLVAKSRGIIAAECYFINLLESSKNHLTYGALLNCYCKDLMTEKAEALMEKMKELNLELSFMPYNSLITLYTKTAQAEKVPAIIQEIKSCDIMPDCYTHNVWMRALASMNEISGVERLIDEMKRDGRVARDWTTYSNLASIYADARLFDKAEKALKEVEIYRIWCSLRLSFPKTPNISYLNMILVLVKFNDLPGAEKCYREWASVCSTYDIRIANAVIGACLKEGSLEKAEVLKARAKRRGVNPNALTWELYLDYYLKNREIKSAVDCIENTILTGRGDGGKWTPSPAVIGELMRHFEQIKVVEGAEHFLEVLKKSKDELGSEVLESLIRIYAAAGKTSPLLVRRIKMENAELCEEGKKLLDAVCKE